MVVLLGYPSPSSIAGKDGYLLLSPVFVADWSVVSATYFVG
jgi:hypothetical protein